MPTESDKHRPIRTKRHARREQRPIDEVAERQHGVIGVRQLAASGLTSDEITQRKRSRYLLQIHRGVYAVGYRPLTRKGRWFAAVLAVGDGAVLSHSSAAMLWGLIPEAEGDVHVTAPRQRRGHQSVVVHRSGSGNEDAMLRCGIPVTSPNRTLIDLAVTATHAQLERAIRQAEYEHLTTATSLLAVVEAVAGHRGVRKLRAALIGVAEAPGITRSRLEEKFVAFLRKHRLPPPQLNARVVARDRALEVDALWKDQRVIVELDGRAAHTTAAAFESDRARDSALLAAGYRVIRITWRRLHDDPVLLASELRPILAESDELRRIRAKRHSRRARAAGFRRAT